MNTPLPDSAPGPAHGPVVISTWPCGTWANEAAWAILSAGGSALDAVEAGAMRVEDDPAEMYVGYGGLPDAAGQVTLDASIMDGRGRCGAVACLTRVRNAIRVARLVMERTPHVMLAGESATRFALENGCPEADLLTPESAEKYRQWKAEQPARRQGPASDPARAAGGSAGAPGAASRLDSHDTVGVLALDAGGALAGACSTSGMAFKLPGRVGDSPIIGAGLYVEPGVGAASATGVGEEVVKVCGSFAITQLMARGMGPAEAIAEVLHRIVSRRGGDTATDVSFVALRADGLAAGLSLRAATQFRYALRTPEENRLIDAGTIG